MTSAPRAPLRRLLLGLALGAAVVSATITLLVPPLLLVRGTVSAMLQRSLIVSLSLGYTISLGLITLLLARHAEAVRVLTTSPSRARGFELLELAALPGRLARLWVVAPLCSLMASLLFAAPAGVDLTSMISAVSLAASMLMTSALPLFAALRAHIGHLLERAPADVWGDQLLAQEGSGRPALYLTRRVTLAVVAPVTLLALGAALIEGAHVRRADERQREETARAVARAVLEPGPEGPLEGSLESVRAAMNAHGFEGGWESQASSYGAEVLGSGDVLLHVPLDEGTAILRFAPSTVWPLDARSVVWVLAILGLASLSGLWLGRALLRDLQLATEALRTLGTDALLLGTRSERAPPVFHAVAELRRAVDRLAERFVDFAQGEERAIVAREATTRARGLFFASVSHDLKSPLNAILGFTELLRSTELLTSGQRENLAIIDRSGRELLAMIETILDFARVEDGQLSLYVEPTPLSALLSSAEEQGTQLGGSATVPLQVSPLDVDAIMDVDRARLARVLAAFIGHALRSCQTHSPKLAARLEEDTVRFVVTVPSRGTSVESLQALLEPTQAEGANVERGLALAIALAPALLRLHGGTVTVTRRRVGAAFELRLPRSAAHDPPARAEPAPPPSNAGAGAPQEASGAGGGVLPRS